VWDSLCSAGSFAYLHTWQKWQRTQFVALLRLALTIHNWYLIRCNWCCLYHCCRCCCWCCAFRWCSALTIACNVPHLMASVALLGIPPIGAVTCMLLTFQTPTITLTATITEHLGLLSLLWIPLLSCCLYLSQFQQFDDIQVDLLLLPHFLGFHLCTNLLQVVGQGVDLVIHQLGGKPPIIILCDILHHGVAMLMLEYCTSRTLSTEIEVVTMLLDLWRLMLHIHAIPELHSWHLVVQCPNIHLHLRLVVHHWVIPLCLCIILNGILLLQWSLHHEENSRLCDYMLLFPYLNFGPIVCVQWIFCTVDNAEMLLLLQQYVDFEAPAFVVHTIEHLNQDHYRFGTVCYGSSQSVLVWDCIKYAVNTSQVRQRSEVPVLISCFTVSIVLNLFIDLNSQNLSV